MTRSSGGYSHRSARSPRRSGTPLISAIVASTGTREQLAACLASLQPQCLGASVQLIVARRASTQELDQLHTDNPGVSFIALPEAATPRELRAAAMTEALGDIVGIATDATVPADDWIATLLARSPASPTSDESNRPSGKQRARRSGPSPRVTPSEPHRPVSPP
jgi:hypothetical protein